MNDIALVRYDAACKALADAKAVDEVKKIRDVAQAMRAYAKQAKNRQLEIDAAEIRIRAERRVGEMMAQGLASGDRAARGRPEKSSDSDDLPKATLKAAGIDDHLADRARKLAAVPASEFESDLSEWRTRVEEEGARVTTKLLSKGERELAKRPLAPPSNGLQFARIAIMKLEEIRDDDSERQQAFDLVRSWIDDREAKVAMHA